MALAALLQVVIAARSPVINADGVTFIRMAQAILESPREMIARMDQHPGYPLLVRAGHGVAAALVRDEAVGAWILGARLAAGLFGVLLLPVIWRLTRLLFDSRAAIVAVFLAAALPLFRRNAADALSDSPHLFLYALSVLLACEGWVRRRWTWFLAAGAASGAAYWVRPEGLGAAGVIAALLLLRAIGRERRGWSLACAAAVVLAAAAVALPYAVLKGKMTGKKDVAALVQFSEQPRSGEESDVPGESAKGSGASAPESPGADARSFRLFPEMPLHLADHFLRALRYLGVVPLAVALWWSVRRRLHPDPQGPVLAAAVFQLPLLAALYATAGYADQRHMMPLIALLMPWVAQGALLMVDALLARLAVARPAVGRLNPDHVAIVVGLLFALLMAPRTAASLHAARIPLVRAAESARAQAKAGDAVLSNSSLPSFYANLPGALARGALPALRAPDGRLAYRFVILDRTRDGFREEWLAQLAPFYTRADDAGGSPAAGGVVFLVAKPRPAPAE